VMEGLQGTWIKGERGMAFTMVEKLRGLWEGGRSGMRGGERRGERGEGRREKESRRVVVSVTNERRKGKGWRLRAHQQTCR
jgi:hypothetical protein